MRILAAPWVLPVASPPVAGGALLVDGGRILAVGPRNEIESAAPGVPVEWEEDAALLPGLFNGHTHLELTGLGPSMVPLPEGNGDFVGWIQEIIRRKREASPEDHARCLAEGLTRCLRGGQTAVADVVSVGGLAGSYPCSGPRVYLFPEVICPQAGDAVAVTASADAVAPHGVARRAGLFAHAPYTVSKEAYRLALDAVRAAGGRLFTHLAESADEARFLLQGDGAIPERLYAGLGLSPPVPPRLHPVEFLEAIGVLGPATTLVHAVHLEARHVETLRRTGAAVVLCPRSNRNLGVGKAPGRRLLDAGVPVGLGTDSSLSAGDLDLWGDILAAVDDYGWSPEEAVRAATAGSAAAAGAGSERGAFAPGFAADILSLRLGGGNDPWERILEAPRIASIRVEGRKASFPEETGRTRSGEERR